MSKRACREICGVGLEQHRPEVAIIRRRDGSGKFCVFVFHIGASQNELHFGLLQLFQSLILRQFERQMLRSACPKLVRGGERQAKLSEFRIRRDPNFFSPKFFMAHQNSRCRLSEFCRDHIFFAQMSLVGRGNQWSDWDERVSMALWGSGTLHDTHVCNIFLLIYNKYRLQLTHDSKKTRRQLRFPGLFPKSPRGRDSV
jgi:hypothetical protein